MEPDKWRYRKIFVVKYALTQGIEEMRVEVNEASGYARKGLLWLSQRDWRATREEAVKAAEELRLKKIKSLEKQLKKLREMRFE
jgi:hypothetical protein